MRKLFFVLIICLPISSICQNQNKIDSLIKLVETSTIDSSKIDFLNELSILFRTNNPKLGLKYTKNALELAEKTNDLKRKASSLNNIGVLLELQGDLTSAMEKYVSSLEISRKINDESGIAKGLNNIGIIYKKENNHEKAIKYYLESLEINSKRNNKIGMAICLNNLGLSSKTLQKYSEADEYYSQCLKIFIEINHTVGQAVVYNNLGIVNNELGDKNKALHYFEKSLSIREEIQNKQGIAVVYNNIGELHIKYNEYNKAIVFLKKSMSITKNLGFKDLLKHNYALLNKAYSDNNNIDSAYRYLSLLSTLKDTLNNQERKNQLSELEVKFETENKEREIEVLEKEKIIQNEQVEKQKWQLVAFASGLILSLIVIIMIFANLKAKSKANKEIERQKQIVDETNEELNQTNEELAAQRDEIETKSQEITDSISYAKRIQEAILPSEKMIEALLPNSFVLYKPKDIIAGDFYWIEKIGDNIMFAVADCTGHGVPGAMVSVICHTALNRVIGEFKCTEPHEILNKTREIVVSRFAQAKNEISDGMDIAFCIWNKKANKFQYSGAYNPLWIIRNNELIEVKGDKQPVGKFIGKEKSFTLHNIDIQEKDTIYLFTDGFTDQFGGEKDKKFGSKRFKELLLSIQQEPIKQQRQILESSLHKWKIKANEEQLDDICVIGVKV